MKKVLASVLAGSMILGMASMASAASTLTLKDSSDSEYKYQLYLYQPDAFINTTDDTVRWEEDTQEAFEAFEKAYNTFAKAADSAESLKSYFANMKAANKEGPVELFNEFIRIAKLDDNDLDTVTDLTTTLGFNTSVAKTSTATSDTTQHTFNDFTIANGSTTIGAMGVYDDADAKIIGRIFRDNSAGVDIRPAEIKKRIPTGAGTILGSGSYVDQNKASIDIADKDQMDDFGLAPHYMYTYGTDDAKEVKFEIVVKHGDDFRVDVASGKVTVSRKRIKADTKNDVDRYQVVVKAAAGVRDFELADFKIELDCTSANKVYYIEGEVAYSDYREVLPDDRLIIKKSNTDNLHDDGCIFDFSEVIDEETRIICEENYVDLLFKGNYGTDFENLRVMTDDIQEVEDFFQDYDIDYYDFIGTPKFAKDITVRIDADSDSYIYEYDKKNGDVVDITDEAEYTSDGWTFKRKALKTYVILEEPYEGGNVKAEKEPVSEEPDEIDEPDETPDDKDATGSKPNPGTGAYPLF